MAEQKEFEEIGHTGGKLTISVMDEADGSRTFQLGWTHQAPRPASLFAVWALPQGHVVATCPLGGIGVVSTPPAADCYQVMIGSDSEGRFGHNCTQCKGYWRSDGFAARCPYCAFRGEQHHFLSKAQREYVRRVMERLMNALNADHPGEYVIDMDVVADAIGKESPKPEFYYSEERQQKRINCSACGAYNDVLGTYAYCCSCGTRNDWDELQGAVKALRERVNTSRAFEACAKELVSQFDSYCSQFMAQLVRRVPLTLRRRERLSKMLFHNLKNSADAFKTVFDIDILEGLGAEDVAFAERLFHRRHVYEHKGGEADERYTADSGDQVRVKQALRETQESVHRLAGIVLRMGQTLHTGFHDIFQPNSERIAWHKVKTRC